MNIQEKIVKLFEKYIFEINGPELWDKMTKEIVSYMFKFNNIDFKFICDKNTNISEAINNNELHGTYYIKLKNENKYKRFDFSIARTGIIFQELKDEYI